MSYLCRVTLTLERTTQVVHHNLGTSRAICKCVCPSKAASCTCDNDDLAVVAEFRHVEVRLV
jgi:hypothetical protein